MKIEFNGHQQTERQVELTKQELFQLFDVMKQSLLDNVEYGQFDGYSFYSEHSKKIIELCETHNVDVAYTKDRLNFFTAIVKQMVNPYV
jgi:hypothetical protein